MGRRFDHLGLVIPALSDRVNAGWSPRSIEDTGIRSSIRTVEAAFGSMFFESHRPFPVLGNAARSSNSSGLPLGLDTFGLPAAPARELVQHPCWRCGLAEIDQRWLTYLRQMRGRTGIMAKAIPVIIPAKWAVFAIWPKTPNTHRAA